MVGFVGVVGFLLSAVEVRPVHLTALTTQESGSVNGSGPVSIRITDLYWRGPAEFLLVGRQVRGDASGPQGALVEALWVEGGEVRFYQAIPAPGTYLVIETGVPLEKFQAFLKGKFDAGDTWRQAMSRDRVTEGATSLFSFVPVRMQFGMEEWMPGARPSVRDGQPVPDLFEIGPLPGSREALRGVSVTIQLGGRGRVVKQNYNLNTGSIIGHFRRTTSEFSYAAFSPKSKLVFARPSQEDLRRWGAEGALGF